MLSLPENLLYGTVVGLSGDVPPVLYGGFFEKYGQAAMPAELILNFHSQGIGSLGFAVDDKHVRGFVFDTGHPRKQLLLVGVDDMVLMCSTVAFTLK